MRTEYKRYLWIWLCLLVLLALTCGSAFLHLGAWNSAVNFAVAVAKALLVALFFMQLRDARALIRIFAVTALFTLGLLFGLSGTDYATRIVHGAGWQMPQQIGTGG
jgi:cytochrome c oxidase subunit 4